MLRTAAPPTLDTPAKMHKFYFYSESTKEQERFMHTRVVFCIVVFNADGTPMVNLYENTIGTISEMLTNPSSSDFLPHPASYFVQQLGPEDVEGAGYVSMLRLLQLANVSEKSSSLGAQPWFTFVFAPREAETSLSLPDEKQLRVEMDRVVAMWGLQNITRNIMFHHFLVERCGHTYIRCWKDVVYWRMLSGDEVISYKQLIRGLCSKVVALASTKKPTKRAMATAIGTRLFSGK